MECVLEKEPYHQASPPPPPTPQSVVSVQMFVTQEIIPTEKDLSYSDWCGVLRPQYRDTLTQTVIHHWPGNCCVMSGNIKEGFKMTLSSGK